MKFLRQPLLLSLLLLVLGGCAVQQSGPPAPVPIGNGTVPVAGTPPPLVLAPSTATVVGQAAAAAVPLAQTVTVTDSAGNPVLVETTLPDGTRALATEWIMLVTPAQRAQLEGQAPALMGFLRAQRPFGLNNGQLLLFQVPADLDANGGILNLVPPALREQIDRNHLYTPQQRDQGSLLPLPGRRKPGLPLRLPLRAACEAPVSIGMVDARVDLEHAVFAGLHEPQRRIISRSFVEDALQQPVQHGTAVAALWLGRHKGRGGANSLEPLLPGATLYSAAVFHAGGQQPEGASAMRVLEALDWLSQQVDVKVINLSLAGPPNRLLEQTVDALQQRHIAVVAAVGNEGPHAPARYPAAYEGVLGVAAVDRSGTVFRWSNQGKHVDYSALGVDLPTAAQGQPLAPMSGTSLAAPVVSAMLACAVGSHGGLEAALAALDTQLLDLGEPGPDPVYGKGLLHPF
jgi:minor extracellular protease Epr